MGNYHDLDVEFIERTLNLIDQYERMKDQFPFEEQYNHTLVLNCLLGLIVLPKEKTQSYIRPIPLDMHFRKESGCLNSMFNVEIQDLRALINELRHCIAHFDLEVKSDNPNAFLVDAIEFYDRETKEERFIASFRATELVPFLRYYASALLANIKQNGGNRR